MLWRVGRLFYRWGQFVTRHPKKILALSLALIVLAIPAIPGGIGLLSPEGWVAGDAQSLRAEAVIEEQFDAGGTRLWALFESPDGDITSDDALSEIHQAMDSARQHPGVEFVADYASTGDEDLISTDGSRSVAIVQLSVDVDPDDVYVDLRDAVDVSDLNFYWGGGAAANYTFNETVTRDLVVQELIALPITLVLLVVIFGAVVAASLPLSIGLAGIATAVGGIAILARLTDTSVYVLHVATMIGLALAIDYSLFIVSRFREEMARRNVPEAVAVTLGTSGKAVFIAGLTVGIGLVGLVFFPAYALRTMGLGGGIVVILAVFFALTTLPAMLTLLGSRINHWQVRRIQPLPASSQGFWHWLAFTVMRRPLIILVTVLVILFTLGSPFLRANFGSPGVELLPADAEPRVAIESLATDFPGQQAAPPIVVVVDTGDDAVLEPDRFGQVAGIYQVLTQMDGIESVEGVFDYSPAGLDSGPDDIATLLESADAEQQTELAQLIGESAIRFNVVSEAPANSSEAEELVRAIRDLETEDEAIEILTTGTTSFNLDMVEAITETLPYTLGFVFVVTYIALFLLLGSVVLPIKAILVNLLSLTAAFGALVWIFQEGNLSGLLMFDAPGYIVPTIAVIMFLVLFGLSMDYEVMMLSRMKEEYERSGNNTTAVAIGLERTGRVITGAALVMIVLFGAGITNQLVMLKSLGVGMAIAIFVDATIARGLLVPSAMRLMGRVNWWAPAPLKRLQERLGMGEVLVERDPVPETSAGQGRQASDSTRTPPLRQLSPARYSARQRRL